MQGILFFHQNVDYKTLSIYILKKLSIKTDSHKFQTQIKGPFFFIDIGNCCQTPIKGQSTTYNQNIKMDPFLFLF